MSGILISFEGIDASGKTTQITRLEMWLREQGFNVLVRREPGGTKLGEKIRDVLLDPASHEMHPRMEFLLYSASRAQLVEQDVIPFLKRERSVVLLDRYHDSSTAYQGAGRKLNLAAVKQVNHFATAGLVPHLTFFLDLPLDEPRRRKIPQLELRLRLQSNYLETPSEKSGKRKSLMKGTNDRIERGTVAFYERVRQGYLAICAEEPDRIVRLDASLSPDEITKQILEKVQVLMKSH